MRSNYNIHKTFLEILYCFLLLCRRTKTAKKIHTHRKILHSLYKGIVMLLCQNSRRHKISHLLSILNCLERSPNRNFCLSIADISTDEAVHNLIAFHIPLCIFNRLKLIFRLLIGKHFLKFLLPDSIRLIGITFRFLAGRIQLHQVLGDIFHSSFDFGLCFVPLLASQPIQFRAFGIGSRIFLQSIKLCSQNIKVAAAAVLNLNIVFDDLIHLNLFYSPVNTQSVIFMYHIISDRRLSKILNFLSGILTSFFLFSLLMPENIRFCDNYKFHHRILKAFACMSVHHHDFSRLNQAIFVFCVKCIQVIVPQILRKAGGSCS